MTSASPSRPLPLSGRLSYAATDAAGELICSILYTGINTPVTSILSALTPDPNERVMLTSFRMFYRKYERMEPQIHAELEARRANS